VNTSSFRFRARDGAELLGRAIEPADRAALARHFQNLSVQSRYRRFLTPKTALNDTELAHFTELDHHDAEALVAFDGDGELVAVARYFVLDDPTRAEVAIAVADRWQHRGVGTAMLAQLMRRAREDGIRAFVASCFVDNREMIGLFRELGESVRFVGQDAGVVDLEIALGAAEAPVSV
jgi:RimJ/RimL family protein N-acetyltransferase